MKLSADLFELSADLFLESLTPKKLLPTEGKIICSWFLCKRKKYRIPPP